MAIELYWGSGSPFAWRVMLTLELKGLSYHSKLLEFSKRDHKSASYLKLNPRGKVPTLKDGDFVIYESVAIMTYLDRQYPKPPLFGKTPREAGLISRTIAECDGYFARAGDKVVRPIFFGKGLEKIEEIRLAAEIVHQEMKSFEATLTQSAWLVGAQITAADIAVFPLVQLLLRAAAKEAAQPLDLGLLPLSQIYPNIARWVQQVERLPGYDRTYPPHWRS